MRQILLALIIFLPFQSFSQKHERELLFKLEYDWLMAEFAVDTTFISKLMDDSFIAIGPSGTVNKHQELAGIHQKMYDRKLENHIVDSLYFDDFIIKMYENVAVVTFVSVTRGRKNDVSFSNRRTRIYDVWIKRGGSWKAVSSQVTPLP